MGGARPRSSTSTALVPITYMNSSAALKAFVGEHGGAVCTSTNARAVLEWALELGDWAEGAGGRKVLFFPDQHLGRNTGYRHGLRRRRHAGVEPPARARRARPRPTSRRPRSCCGRATARCTSASGPSTSRPSGPSTPTASSIAHPECAHEVCELADQVGSTDYIIKAVEAAPPGSIIAVGTEIHLVQRLERRDARQDHRVARPADLPVLDDVPHRRPPPGLGAREPGRGPGRATGSPSTRRPPSGPRSPSSGCSPSPDGARRTTNRPSSGGEDHVFDPANQVPKFEAVQQLLPTPAPTALVDVGAGDGRLLDHLLATASTVAPPRPSEVARPSAWSISPRPTPGAGERAPLRRTVVPRRRVLRGARTPATRHLRRHAPSSAASPPTT